MTRERHPLGLYILFFTEMWERFGFYCMEAVFSYYMLVSQYPYLRENYSLIYGFYLAGVYFTPFVGGILSEWRLGYSLSILAGGLCMAIGYGLLSLEPAICFGLGLAGIVIGNGLFKPNISSLVGKLYPQGDSRVDSAFTIFYMGINVGAFASPIAAAITGIVIANAHEQQTLFAGLSQIGVASGGHLPSTLTAVAGANDVYEQVSRIGYLAVFALAACGMLIGELIFLLFGRFVRPVSAQPTIMGSNSAQEIPADLQKRRNLALIVFFAINILFWMAFKQKGNALALWAKDRTDLAVPSWLSSTLGIVGLDKLMLHDGKMGKELFSSLNPFFVIVFSPLLVGFWGLLRSMKMEVPTPAKLVIGFALTSASFAVMWRFAATTAVDERVTPLALVACYAILTLGELCLSPMGLSLVSRLAPHRTRAVWMGLFFCSTAIGGYLAGAVRQYTKEWDYDQFFRFITYVLAGAGVLMAAAYPIVAAAVKPPPGKSKG